MHHRFWVAWGLQGCLRDQTDGQLAALVVALRAVRDPVGEGGVEEKKKSLFYPSRFSAGAPVIKDKTKENKRKANRCLLTCISHIYLGRNE